jgi:NADH dehydrogenase (ubiquinone) Fe-S protein 6
MLGSKLFQRIDFSLDSHVRGIFFKSFLKKTPKNEVASETAVTGAEASSKSPLSSDVEISKLLANEMSVPGQVDVNRKLVLQKTWSPSMRAKNEAMRGPLFEQAIIEAQPIPLPAIDLLQQEPINYTEKRIIYCNGGHGALGHPRVYINLDKPEAASCGYCGKQFMKTNNH